MFVISSSHAHLSRSMGRGNIIVEFFSAEIVLRVCKYRSCRAEGASAMTSAASFNAREAFCSPSAAITWKMESNGRRKKRDSLVVVLLHNYYCCICDLYIDEVLIYHLIAALMK